MNNSIEIATDLAANNTNVKVNTVEELQKFIKFAGGKYNVYVWVTGFNEWMTIAEFLNSNEIEVLFS